MIHVSHSSKTPQTDIKPERQILPVLTFPSLFPLPSELTQCDISLCTLKGVTVVVAPGEGRQMKTCHSGPIKM